MTLQVDHVTVKTIYKSVKLERKDCVKYLVLKDENLGHNDFSLLGQRSENINRSLLFPNTIQRRIRNTSYLRNKSKKGLCSLLAGTK